MIVAQGRCQFRGKAVSCTSARIHWHLRVLAARTRGPQNSSRPTKHRYHENVNLCLQSRAQLLCLCDMRLSERIDTTKFQRALASHN
jgi:hypothetical protein